MACEQDYWNQMYANACDQSAPSLLWRPRLFVDGNQWCALYGENLQDGVAGFGETPDKAMRNFDLNWCEQKVGAGSTALVRPNDRVEGRDAALSRRVPSHDGLCGNGSEVGAGDTVKR